ncbi:hypothetical protein EDB84DRAFT_1439217 [Lactarius hengduanensis]|nr:hypothetical protein EDB84DRAFT_1439217 [Lactarius hengduanensis]
MGRNCLTQEAAQAAQPLMIKCTDRRVSELGIWGSVVRSLTSLARTLSDNSSGPRRSFQELFYFRGQEQLHSADRQRGILYYSTGDALSCGRLWDPGAQTNLQGSNQRQRGSIPDAINGGSVWTASTNGRREHIVWRWMKAERGTGTRGHAGQSMKDESMRRWLCSLAMRQGRVSERDKERRETRGEWVSEGEMGWEKAILLMAARILYIRVRRLTPVIASSIGLTVTSSLLEKLSAIERPFSELEDLVLLSRDSVPLTQHFSLLAPSTGLVDLQLHEILIVGYFSPEAFTNALAGMTHLRILSLHFLSFLPRRNPLGLPPPPGERVVFPALTYLKYRGTSKYLDSLVARVDTPHLGDIDITFFSQPTMDASQLGRFIDRIEILPVDSYRADILTSERAISISFTHPNAPTRLELRISCKQLDCEQGEVDGEQWLKLIRAFGGAKDFYVGSEHTMDILRALGQAGGEHPTDITVLPVLRDLRVRKPMVKDGLLWDAVQSFITSRRLSGRAVELDAVMVPVGPMSTVPIAPTRVVDEDYDEGVVDALMGLASYRSPQAEQVPTSLNGPSTAIVGRPHHLLGWPA